MEARVGPSGRGNCPGHTPLRGEVGGSRCVCACGHVFLAKVCHSVLDYVALYVVQGVLLGRWVEQL